MITTRLRPRFVFFFAVAWMVTSVSLPGSQASAAIVPLSFAGTVDGIGYKVGGVAAPIGSPFTLDVGIDDSAAATGRYAVESVSYTLAVGTYSTVTDWETELVATQTGDSITLISDPLFTNPSEHFLLNLRDFGPSSFDNPHTWGGPAALSGDIIVRGFGGFTSPNELSGDFPYTGVLRLSVVPEPASIVLLTLCVVALECGRPRRENIIVGACPFFPDRRLR